MSIEPIYFTRALLIFTIAACLVSIYAVLNIKRGSLKSTAVQLFLLVPYSVGFISGAIRAITSIIWQAFKLGHDKAQTKINGQENDNTTTD